jgi:hypothetical protein
MGNIPIAFLVLGALFTLYVVAATWRSKDASSQMRSDSARPRPDPTSVDLRRTHRWRSPQRPGKSPDGPQDQ